MGTHPSAWPIAGFRATDRGDARMPQRRSAMPTLPAADFLVIGSGVAGLRTAIGLSQAGRVLMLTKGSPAEGSSIYAQGGVAVASEEDDIALHRDDTLRAGKGLCRPEAVQVLVEEGPARVQDLIRWGARFDRAGDGYALAREAAHSRHRILRAGGDATGTEMVRVLLNRARSLPQIAWRDHHFTIDLLLDAQGHCVGALELDESSGAVKQVKAKAVVLATGGAGQIYARTTNPPVATGDGMAMAYRAGAIVEDMEFVQFHPTALYLPATPQFLLTEAMRGEGGILRNIKGEAFMKRYHEMAEMAPRDIVSRAIWNEMVAASAPYASGMLPGRGVTVAQDVAAGEAEDDHGDHLDMEKLLNSLRRLMWEKVGIIRSKQGLLSALAQLEKWEERLRDRCRTRRELEVQNMVTVGHLVATAALQREHSLGAHFRSDHPEEFASGWDRHTQLRTEAPGRARVRGAGVKA